MSLRNGFPLELECGGRSGYRMAFLLHRVIIEVTISYHRLMPMQPSLYVLATTVSMISTAIVDVDTTAWLLIAATLPFIPPLFYMPSSNALTSPQHCRAFK